MNIFKAVFCGLLLAGPAGAATLSWTNTAGGSWQVASNWFPNTVPAAGDTVIITAAGSYTVLITNSVSLTALRIGSPGSPTLLVDNYATLSCPSMVVTNGGTMTWSNSWINGGLTILAGATLNCAAPVNSYIYGLAITNNGTVNWSSGGLSTSSTYIYNAGQWLITGNNSLNNGGSPWPVWINTGLLRKSGATGTTSLDLVNFFNLPGGTVEAQSGTLQFNGGLPNLFTGLFTNSAAGTFNFINGTWTDAGGVFAGAGAQLFTSGTYNLRTNAPAGLKFLGGDVWVTGTGTFQNAGAITNLTIEGAALRGSNTVTGTLNFTSGSIPETLRIATNGQLVISGAANKLIYGLTLINQGSVTCGGSLNVGSGGTIVNSGLWQITGDYSVSYGGNAHINWTNSGILRKTAGTAISFSVLDDNFVNLPGGTVECLAGRLILNGGPASQFGGTFNAVGLIDLANGTWTDAGGTMTGSNRLVSGTLNLRTNVPPGLQLIGGTIAITGTNSFQNGGAITNLTLDGATLSGSNTVSGGTLTMNSGSLSGQLTVQADGQLLFAGTGSKFITPLTLVNRGTVQLNGSSVNTGNTAIANYGQWLIPGDYGLGYGGVGTSTFTNLGTFRKTTGSTIADNTSVPFYNQTGAVVQVDTGTLRLPASSTNLAGTLRLNGGQLNANGILAVAGGTVDGAGVIGANSFTGGTISPGSGGAGLVSFTSGLNLNSNVTLTIDGTGPVPGSTYDTLSVTGTVALANATLAITAMPSVPPGTTFTLINNDGVDAVSGTFAGLAENSVITVGAQTFRIHYAGGTGNDVTLVRDGTVTGPKLVWPASGNNPGTFLGTNAIPLTVFTVRASTNLVTWTNIGTVTSSVNGGWSFTDTNAGKYARRFYNTTN